ncbi:hypothetical protein GCM10028808_10040 [Spirosoma migulaei]
MLSIYRVLVNSYILLIVSLISILRIWVGEAKAQSGRLSPLIPTPRATFSPTPSIQKGYWNIDVVGDFYLPANKSVTFNGAGRNLHVQQDWEKLFRRGFTAIERTRMTFDEQRIPIYNEKPLGWKSRLKQSQRAMIVVRNHFYYPPTNEFNLLWTKDRNYAPYTYFVRPPGDLTSKNSLRAAMDQLSDGCRTFGDCPPTGEISTYGRIFLDVEDDGIPVTTSQQEQVNLFVFMAASLRTVSSATTEIGSIEPVPHNNFGFTRYADYSAGPDWLWATPAQHTPANPSLSILSSQDRGMPDSIVGKSFSDYVDFQMPGVYNRSPAFDYAASHTGEQETHWLAGVLGEQEVNSALSSKKRIAWQWMFNTQSGDPGDSPKADHAAPPAVAEGTAIFYWFTGADGVLFWDDIVDLTPNQTILPDNDPEKGVGNDRNYACYEHYLHGLWRLFYHHRDLFNGRETYLNQRTECSFDNGQTWHQYNAGDLKRNSLPFARAIVNGDQILIAAHNPYATPDKKIAMQVRYTEGGYEFITEINLTGDEIFLGRATMPKVKRIAVAVCNNCPK